MGNFGKAKLVERDRIKLITWLKCFLVDKGRLEIQKQSSKLKLVGEFGHWRVWSKRLFLIWTNGCLRSLEFMWHLQSRWFSFINLNNHYYFSVDYIKICQLKWKLIYPNSLFSPVTKGFWSRSSSGFRLTQKLKLIYVADEIRLLSLLLLNITAFHKLVLFVSSLRIETALSVKASVCFVIRQNDRTEKRSLHASISQFVSRIRKSDA